jgi:putative transposase
MSRERRLNIPGAVYHVMNRGNRKALIFEDDRDRKRFVWLLVQLLSSFEVELLAGCLMGNHFHLVVATPRGNLSSFMQQLQGQFARYSNWRHNRVGHLFQGRFRCVLVETDLHLLTAVSYVFFNPVVAGFCECIEDWKWSTYGATVGFTSAPEYLSIDWLESLFPGASLEASQQLFHKLMDQETPVRAYVEQLEWLAGCEPVSHVLRSYIGDRLRTAVLPREYSKLCRPAIEDLFRGVVSKKERDLAIHDAHVIHGYTCEEIAMFVALRTGTVANVVTAVRRQKVGVRPHDANEIRTGYESGVRPEYPNISGNDRARGSSRGLSPRHPRKNRG